MAHGGGEAGDPSGDSGLEADGESGLEVGDSRDSRGEVGELS